MPAFAGMTGERVFFAVWHGKTVVKRRIKLIKTARVIPANAGIHGGQGLPIGEKFAMDASFRWHDGGENFLGMSVSRRAISPFSIIVSPFQTSFQETA